MDSSLGEVFKNSSSEIADLIADLLHLAARIDQGDDSIESTLRLARMHYDGELTEELGNAFGLRCPECGNGGTVDEFSKAGDRS